MNKKKRKEITQINDKEKISFTSHNTKLKKQKANWIS